MEFIRNDQSMGLISETSNKFSFPLFPRKKKNQLDFEIIFGLVEYENIDPLQMIIQGNAGTENSYLIHVISHALYVSTSTAKIPLILLVPTRYIILIFMQRQ